MGVQRARFTMPTVPLHCKHPVNPVCLLEGAQHQFGRPRDLSDVYPRSARMSAWRRSSSDADVPGW